MFDMDKIKKRIHLICNAHIDPVWQWEWEEGAAETLSTFRIAAKFCEDYDDFVFCHNEALLYQWIEEYEPTLFNKIIELVKSKKWHIMGGWHLQPDCNMPSGEGLVRQALMGRQYFSEKFGVYPTTAINLDSFGHTRGLVQILAKSGYDSYLFCRPNDDFCHLPSNTFNWVGYDGSSVTCCRVPHGYNSGLGHSTDKINSIIDLCPDNDFAVCLWGVGNHGGGPSKIDLENIASLQKNLIEKGIQVIHSTPESYFSELSKKTDLPKHFGDINLWAPGCYTSQVRIKQKYRQIENIYFMTERMCSQASAQGLIEYPKKELGEAMYDLLTMQFHDILPGSSIQPVEETALRSLDHGLEILSKIKGKAFFALSSGQKIPESDEIPILIYNPHPYKIDGDFECEFMLWDQNWAIEFSMPTVYQNGVKLPSQPEKEMSNIPIDWRKRVIFHATLEPMQMNRFDCKFVKVPSKPIAIIPSSTTHFIFDCESLHIEINRSTGLIDKYNLNGVEYLKNNAFTLDVMQDNIDPWGMNDREWKNKIGEFSLLSDEDGTEFSNVSSTIPSVRVIENGNVRTVIEAVFGYKSSRAVVRYKLSKKDTAIDIEVRITWNEKSKMVKMNIPVQLEDVECFGQVAYGVEQLPTTGRENVSQRYLILKNNANAISLINDGIYGSSCENNELKLTLLRSPSYTAHPIGDRPILPQDRFMPYIEQGERLFNIKFNAGYTEKISEDTARQAALFNEKPIALSLFPSGAGELPLPAVIIESDNGIEMPTLKKSENSDDYIIRLFNSTNEVKSLIVHIPMYKLNECYNISPFEIKTLKINKNTIEVCSLMEN